jgi:uncharacterized membrane protein (DUF373 family)
VAVYGPGQDGETAAPIAQRPPAGTFERYRDAASGALRQTRNAWPVLTAYERFEQVVSLVVTGLVASLVVVALIHLISKVLLLILYDLVDPAEQEVFQAVFGMVMTVLIALEFNHSILGALERRHGVVQLRTVVLIALLALVRKFIVIDVSHAAPATILGLAASVLALGAVYWLVRDQDRREAAEEDARDPGGDGS